MFYFIKGQLAMATPSFAVIDAGGVGYKLTISQSTYESLPQFRTKEEPPIVKLFTYLAVREGDIELFGFISETELSTFKLLNTVSGVGPKAAISILSSMSPEKFALAVCTEDKKSISRANGIGPKTAARIILELKDKLMKQSDIDTTLLKSVDINVSSGVSATLPKGSLSEAQDALMVLGYSRIEAINAIKAINTDGMELEDIIKSALKQLMK